jgi:GNAT superfamily N-acetyltransferase
MNSAIIRPAVPADAEAIWQVKRDSWLATYPNAESGLTAEHIRQHFEGEHGELVAPGIARIRAYIVSAPAVGPRFFVAEADGVTAGMAAMAAPFTEEDGRRRVGALYLLPGFQGQGLGHRLLEAVLDWHGRDHDVYLVVTSYNARAIGFYERHGFALTEAAIADSKPVGSARMPLREMVRRATAPQGSRAR